VDDMGRCKMNVKRGYTKLNTIVLISLIGMLSTLFITCIPITHAQEPQLYLYIQNSLQEYTNEIYENEDLFISAYSLDENNSPVFQFNVTINFLQQSYSIPLDDVEILITAPEVSTTTEYTIQAEKSGFESANETITIINKQQFIITPDSYIVEANKRFSVVITDENNIPQEGVLVGIQNYDGENSIDTTNSLGRAWLTAPDNRDQISIKAQKEGYISTTTTIAININPTLIELLQQNPYTPIIIAVILLIIAVLLVNVRQRQIKRRERYDNVELSKTQSKTSSRDSKQTIKKGKTDPSKQPYIINGDKTPATTSSKIEEIRINRPRKDTSFVAAYEEPPQEKQKSSVPSTKGKSDWFKGTEDFRYQLDKITGKVDEKGKDKWFEGTKDIRQKIDDTLKKKDKHKHMR
jgi:hypothetical protein